MIQKPNIHLVGMPGAGKSTVGKALARQLDFEFVDADHEMVKHTGVPISTIFELEGESGFRVREMQLIAELCERTGIILATGGGAVLNKDSREHLKKTGVVIYLHASLDLLLIRTRNDTKRPLLQGKDPRNILKTLLETREPLYREVADLIVETNRQNVGKLVREIVDLFSRINAQHDSASTLANEPIQPV